MAGEGQLQRANRSKPAVRIGNGLADARADVIVNRADEYERDPLAVQPAAHQGWIAGLDVVLSRLLAPLEKRGLTPCRVPIPLDARQVLSQGVLAHAAVGDADA